MKDVFTDMLYVDTLRGGHSTGAAIVKRDKNEVLMEKAPMPGTSFIYTEPYKKLMDTIGVKTMIGHNRYATIGEKTVKNAHPFAFENVVGAHNGTIDKMALKELENWEKYGTDSEAIYNSIDKIGLKATIEKLTGAWALTYANTQDGTMNIIRNSKRPLYYAYTKSLETLLWASESEMLVWAVSRHGFDLLDDHIFEIAADSHYRWEVPEFVGGKFNKPTVSKVEGYKWVCTTPAVKHNYGNESGWTGYGAANQLWLDGYDEDGEQHSYVPSVPKPPVAPAIVHPKRLPKAKSKINTKRFRPPYKDHNHKVMNKSQFFDLTKTTCVYCNDAGRAKEYEWGDFIHVLHPDMDGRKIFLCEECYNDNEVFDLVTSSINP
jgi:hypothetical protein